MRNVQLCPTHASLYPAEGRDTPHHRVSLTAKTSAGMKKASKMAKSTKSSEARCEMTHRRSKIGTPQQMAAKSAAPKKDAIPQTGHNTFAQLTSSYE
eukprot:scaffold232314_cov32-Tisochrysis_lutea.AAC.4